MLGPFFRFLTPRQQKDVVTDEYAQARIFRLVGFDLRDTYHVDITKCSFSGRSMTARNALINPRRGTRVDILISYREGERYDVTLTHHNDGEVEFHPAMSESELCMFFAEPAQCKPRRRRSCGNPTHVIG